MSSNPHSILCLLAIFVLLFAGGAESGSPQLIFRDGTGSYGQLQSLSLDGEHVRSTLPVRTNNYRDGISYDARTGQIYWAARGSIYRQRSDGTGLEIIVNSTVSANVFGLAYDWVADNIYYTNYDSSGHIGVCSLRSRACAITIDNLYYPLHIALHPQTRSLYWTSYGYASDGYVYKASIDGSSPREITEQLNYLGRIAVDHQASRLYWTSLYYDTIESSDLHGTNRQTALGDTGRNINGVAVHGDMLYWVENNDRIKADSKLNASTSVVPLLNGTNIDDVQILSLDNQPPLTTESPCEGHPCSHICVLAEVSYRCLCPSGFRLGSDGKTCKDLDAKLIYWSEKGSTVEIQILSLNSSIRTSVPMNQGGRPGGISYNAETAQIYWSFNYKNTINRMEIDGTGKEAVFNTGGVSVRGIAVDWNASNIYYTDNVLNHIGVCSLNSGSCSVLIKEGPNEPTDIAVYLRDSKIFWVDSGSKSIMTAYMDGSSLHAVAGAAGRPYALSIDQESGLLFWVDSLDDKIRRTPAYSESEELSLSLSSGVVALGVDVRRGGLYWVEHYSNKTSAVRTATIYSSSYLDKKTLMESTSGEIWSNIQLVSLSGQPGV